MQHSSSWENFSLKLPVSPKPVLHLGLQQSTYQWSPTLGETPGPSGILRKVSYIFQKKRILIFSLKIYLHMHMCKYRTHLKMDVYTPRS